RRVLVAQVLQVQLGGGAGAVQACDVGGDRVPLPQRDGAGIGRLQQHLVAALGLLAGLGAQGAQRCDRAAVPLPCQVVDDVRGGGAHAEAPSTVAAGPTGAAPAGWGRAGGAGGGGAGRAGWGGSGRAG